MTCALKWPAKRVSPASDRPVRIDARAGVANRRARGGEPQFVRGGKVTLRHEAPPGKQAAARRAAACLAISGGCRSRSLRRLDRRSARRPAMGSARRPRTASHMPPAYRTITEIAFDAGFNDLSYFNRA